MIGRVVQYTGSIIVWLSVLPVSERTVALVWPLKAILEQTDPKRGPVSIKDFLNGLVLDLVPHPGQVRTVLTTVILGHPPGQIGKNDIVGAIICKQDFHTIDMVLYQPSLNLTAPESDGLWSRLRK